MKGFIDYACGHRREGDDVPDMVQLVRLRRVKAGERCPACIEAEQHPVTATERQRIEAERQAKAQRSKERLAQRGPTPSMVIVAERRVWLESIKDGYACALCGESANCCLDFHHNDPATKRFSISSAIGQSRRYSLQDILDEMSRCTCLCRNCHAKEHERMKRQQLGKVG